MSYQTLCQDCGCCELCALTDIESIDLTDIESIDLTNDESIAPVEFDSLEFARILSELTDCYVPVPCDVCGLTGWSEFFGCVCDPWNEPFDESNDPVANTKLGIFMPSCYNSTQIHT